MWGWQMPATGRSVLRVGNAGDDATRGSKLKGLQSPWSAIWRFRGLRLVSGLERAPEGILMIVRFILILAVVFGSAASASWSFADELPPAETYVRGFCPQSDMMDFCEHTLKSFPEDYRKAIAGDYQGQRNVAFCLQNGCKGAVEKRAVLACAWRKVILASAHLEIGDTDFMSHRDACSNLGSAEHSVAVNQADAILRIIKPGTMVPAPLTVLSTN
jgi:hypothetical protein